MPSSKINKDIKRLLFKIINLCLSVFPVKRNRVFFLSFYGNSYSDNPKAISEALYDKYGDEFDFIWVVASESIKKTMPDYVKTCRYNSIQMVYYMVTSKVWVSNFCLPKGTFKKKSQYYIQTWHGDRGFKKILNDVPGKHQYIYETNHADLMITGSEFGEKFYYRGGFRYGGDLLKVGCPRNDLFFTDTKDIETKIRLHYHLKDTDRILLFAPTYRNRYKKEPQIVSLDFIRVRDILESVTSEKWKVLIRSHNSNSQYGFKIGYSDDVISVTDYPDMNELLQITDLLISDYSSSIGDFCLSGKLSICYQDDFEDYLAKDRELCFKMEDSPFVCAKSPQELYGLLTQIKEINSNDNCKAIIDFYGIYDFGQASSKVVEKIHSVCFNS
jgi:CDP-glycerol glycerophosphotransferase